MIKKCMCHWRFLLYYSGHCLKNLILTMMTIFTILALPIFNTCVRSVKSWAITVVELTNEQILFIVHWQFFVVLFFLFLIFLMIRVRRKLVICIKFYIRMHISVYYVCQRKMWFLGEINIFFLYELRSLYMNEKLCESFNLVLE